jgi:hypothetical protein
MESLARLRSRSCISAVACDDDGNAELQPHPLSRHDASVFLYAFDLIELNGDDLRRRIQAEPINMPPRARARVMGS